MNSAAPAKPATAPLRKLTEAEEVFFAKLPLWLKAAQVREALGNCSEESLRALRHTGKIDCRDFRSPGSRRPTFKYYRESVKVYLATRLSPADLLGV